MNQYGGLQSVEQLYGDCYAHVSTTVILKLLKKLGIVEDVRNLDGKDKKYIDDLRELDNLETEYIQAKHDTGDPSNIQKLTDIEKRWVELVGEIKPNGFIVQKDGINLDITNILASQKIYYRELYLFIIEHMGVNGGDYNAVFKWLVEQVNSTDLNSKDMPNKKNGGEHNLEIALINFNDSTYTFKSEYTKEFIQTNVIKKIKDKGVKLKCIQTTMLKNYSYISEYPSKTSGISLLDKLKTISKKEIWEKIKNLNTKKLYAALSININCIQNEHDCSKDGALNHAVTITSSRDTTMTIKNSWGIEYGSFGKFNIANHDIKNFSIGYIDIVNPEVGDLETVVDPHLIESHNGGKKYHRTKSRKNKGKKRKANKSKKHKNISTK